MCLIDLWGFVFVEFSGVSTLSMIKFEGGYVVETVFDGSKLGIEPYSVGVSPGGELLILDAENSNVHKISTPFSQCKLSFCINLSLQLCGLDYIWLNYKFRNFWFESI